MRNKLCASLGYRNWNIGTFITDIKSNEARERRNTISGRIISAVVIYIEYDACNVILCSMHMADSAI